MTQSFYSTAEAAAHLGLTERRVRQLMREGKLKSCGEAKQDEEAGRPAYLFTLAELQRYASVFPRSGKYRVQPRKE